MRREIAAPIELLLFTKDPSWAERCARAGIAGFVTDWEYRGKSDRQRDADTEINCDTSDDLAALRHIEGVRRVCRINGFSRVEGETASEIELAIANGATDLLLPMVEHPREVEDFLRMIDGRCAAGILVETKAACDVAVELAKLPLDRVYVGLNDLAISRGSESIFEPLADGLALGLRECFEGTRFGLGGLTLVGGGYPIPCHALMSELARHACDFTFFRRSFSSDVHRRGLDTPGTGAESTSGSAPESTSESSSESNSDRLADAIAEIQSAWMAMGERTQDRIESDHREFRGCLGRALQLTSPE